MGSAVAWLRGLRGQRREAWAAWRYDTFLPWAGRNRAAGRMYTELVAQVETWRDSSRRIVATDRIRRWLKVSWPTALRIYLRSLESEAREEVDSMRFMTDEAEFDRWLPSGTEAFDPGPTLFATLHLGSPVLAFAYLKRRSNLDVRVIIRDLDALNPMESAKIRWGIRKVAWVRHLAAGGVLSSTASATAEAREHLLAGGAIFAAIDIPGNVVSRTSNIQVHGERLRFSSGIVRIAELARSKIVPVIALGGGRTMRIHFGTPIEARAPNAFEATFRQLVGFIERYPGDWWLWPLVAPSE